MEYLISFFIGYFSGAIPFGFIISKLKGIDIRKHGSGNIGFSNVFRTVGKIEGIAVLFLDIAKGFLPVLLLIRYYGYHYGIIAGIAAVLGHMFTPVLKFKGGKGVATGLGIFIGLAPLSALFTLIVWLIVVVISRYVSLGSLTAAIALPLFIYFSRFIGRDEYNIFLLIFTILVCLLVIIMHRPNIKRLVQGKERKFSLKKNG
jgi:glycerol-3-phosphate acyltransferase PlsY